MGKMTGNDKSVWGKRGSWLKTKIIPLLVLLLVIATTVSLFILTQRYPEKIEEFESYGYLGVFLISLVSNATVILPVPGILIIFPLAVTYNPVLVGLIGATGGVIGEITGYLAGYSGRGMIKTGRMYNRVEGWMKRWGAWAIFVFAVTPFLLLDVAGMVAGALRFSFWKFILVAWVGKSLKYIILMLAVAWGWDVGLHFFDCAGP
jgi:membrane protein YqaA with SNARE-associated domain